MQGAEVDPDGGSLIYTWTAAGPSGAAAPVFSVNGSNAAQNTVVTFSAAGSYLFTVTITDPGGLAAASTVNVTVNQTLTSISVQPIGGLMADGTEPFAATALDQFNTPLAAQPQFTWLLAGEGSISGTGVFTPPYTAGTATIQATSGSVTGSDIVPLPGRGTIQCQFQYLMEHGRRVDEHGLRFHGSEPGTAGRDGRRGCFCFGRPCHRDPGRC